MTIEPNMLRSNVDAETLTTWLVEKISAVLGVEPGEVDVHDRLAEYGMDSRQFVDLTFELEELLGYTIPATILWDNPSIALLVRALTSPPNAGGSDPPLSGPGQ